MLAQGPEPFTSGHVVHLIIRDRLHLPVEVAAGDIVELAACRQQNHRSDALVARVDELPGFPDGVGALGMPTSVDDALSDLTATFARMMLANRDAHPFGLVHSVTPHVDDLPFAFVAYPDKRCTRTSGWSMRRAHCSRSVDEQLAHACHA